MRKFVFAAAALSLVAASPAYAITGSGTISFDFTQFNGPFAGATPATINDPANWLLTGAVNGQIPTVTGVNVPAPFGIVDIGGALPLSGNSVDMVYTNIPNAIVNNITFTPAAGFTALADHTPFMLGTLSFTNGQWVGGNRPLPNDPTVLDFTLQTHSADQPAFNQAITDSITFQTNQALNDIDCATNPHTQQDEADFIYITGAPQLGSLRVYDAFCAPPNTPNFGSVEVWAEFGSLDLLSFRNPTGGAFIVPSTAPGPLHGVPEPTAWALLLSGFGLLGSALRLRRSGRAVPAHA